jgi:hypothetical protein
VGYPRDVAVGYTGDWAVGGSWNSAVDKDTTVGSDVHSVAAIVELMLEVAGCQYTLDSDPHLVVKHCPLDEDMIH